MLHPTWGKAGHAAKYLGALGRPGHKPRNPMLLWTPRTKCEVRMFHSNVRTLISLLMWQRGLVIRNLIVCVVNERLCQEERKKTQMPEIKLIIYNLSEDLSPNTNTPNPCNTLQTTNASQYYPSYIMTSTLVFPNPSFEFNQPDTKKLNPRYQAPNTYLVQFSLWGNMKNSSAAPHCRARQKAFFFQPTVCTFQGPALLGPCFCGFWGLVFASSCQIPIWGPCYFVSISGIFGISLVINIRQISKDGA